MIIENWIDTEREIVCETEVKGKLGKEYYVGE